MNVHPNKFGPRSGHVHHDFSDDWEMPNGPAEFAHIVDTPERFHARLNLSELPPFEPKEIDVGVYDYSIAVHAEKANPSDPNRPLRTLEREYHLPDNTDLDTLKFKRNNTKNIVTVDAEKNFDYGRPVKLHITDVNPEVRPSRYVH